MIKHIYIEEKTGSKKYCNKQPSNLNKIESKKGKYCKTHSN